MTYDHGTKPSTSGFSPQEFRAAMGPGYQIAIFREHRLTPSQPVHPQARQVDKQTVVRHQPAVTFPLLRRLLAWRPFQPATPPSLLPPSTDHHHSFRQQRCRHREALVHGQPPSNNRRNGMDRHGTEINHRPVPVQPRNSRDNGDTTTIDHDTIDRPGSNEVVI